MVSYYFDRFTKSYRLEKVDLSEVYQGLIRACWILTYRRSQGENISKAHEYRYLRVRLKGLLIKHAVKVDYSLIENVDSFV